MGTGIAIIISIWNMQIDKHVHEKLVTWFHKKEKITKYTRHVDQRLLSMVGMFNYCFIRVSDYMLASVMVFVSRFGIVA